MNAPGGGALPPSRTSPTVLTLVGACVLMYFISQASGYVMQRHFALWPLVPGLPAASRFEVWQLVTYGFMHANTSHLLFNMLALWTFGRILERDWGSSRLAVYYLVCVVSAGALHLAFAAAGLTRGALVVGASGGVFGLLLAFAMRYPDARVVPLLPPIPMRAATLAVLYGAAALMLGVTGKASFIAHFAHLGGMVGGLVLIFAMPQWYRR